MSDSSDGAGILVMFVAGLFVGGLVGYCAGTDNLRPRACAAEFATAKTQTDTLRVIKADAGCLELLKGK